MVRKKKTSEQQIPFTPLIQDIENMKRRLVELQGQIKHVMEKLNMIEQKIETIENEVKTQHLDIVNIALNLSQQRKKTWMDKLRWWKK